ncbi:UDP-N-acetylmuramoyl-L-alanyl-D-glutamate--2, 6-diaminopimelate ligase [Burkholderiales bacterium]|nr:UDP-N-acetylmuramoyl-L-alanyl-D-glutamate--2, 6-diaminopimelate ligase [Burkholderiales bacterium]
MHGPEANVRAVGDWLRAKAPPGVDLRIDSRTVTPGDVFVALPGRHVDGLRFVAQALARGASALVVDEASWAQARSAGPGSAQESMPSVPDAVPLLSVRSLGKSLGPIAADYYGDASAQLRTIGVTGTNGKTSSCQWIAQLLTAAGQPCATIGTLGFGFPGALRSELSDLTTPDAASLQRLARKALDEGACALAMEVSSIGLEQGRVEGICFDVALFTNLSRDHLDYHADMASYGAAKRKLFDWPTLSHAVLNVDDDFGRVLAQDLAARGLPVTGVGSAADPAAGAALACRLRAQTVEHHPDGMRIAVVCERGRAVETAAVDVALLGEFNVVNLLGVLGVALACEISLGEAAALADGLQAPPGRLQRVAGADADGPLAVVDYAHTPDAIAKALDALRPLARARGGRLCIVFGAGGDRDRGKRAVMGAAAARGAEDIVLTSDNPRSENADAIIDQVAAGIPAGVQFRRNADRAQAIGDTLQRAGVGDVVLIAGKGHEQYQEISGQRLPFSDYAIARGALLAREGRS